MGQQKVKSHTRRNPKTGKVTEVNHYQRTGLDAVTERLREPVKRWRQAERKARRRQRRHGLLQPRRGWRRLRRAWDHARKRRKLAAAVLAVGGLAEIAGFVAARGTGAVVLGAALALTSVAGGLLAASGGGTPGKARPNPPRGVPPRPPNPGPHRPSTRPRTDKGSAADRRTAWERRHAESTFLDADGRKVDLFGNPKDEE